MVLWEESCPEGARGLVAGDDVGDAFLDSTGALVQTLVDPVSVFGDARLRILDERIDHDIDVDTLSGGDVGDRVAVFEGRAQLVLCDAEQLSQLVAVDDPTGPIASPLVRAATPLVSSGTPAARPFVPGATSTASAPLTTTCVVGRSIARAGAVAVRRTGSGVSR